MNNKITNGRIIISLFLNLIKIFEKNLSRILILSKVTAKQEIAIKYTINCELPTKPTIGALMISKKPGIEIGPWTTLMYHVSITKIVNITSEIVIGLTGFLEK
jgi:hypothetical protein